MKWGVNCDTIKIANISPFDCQELEREIHKNENF